MEVEDLAEFLTPEKLSKPHDRERGSPASPDTIGRSPFTSPAVLTEKTM